MNVATVNNVATLRLYISKEKYFDRINHHMCDNECVNHLPHVNSERIVAMRNQTR